MSNAAVDPGRTHAQRRALWIGVVGLAAFAVVVAGNLAWMCDDAFIAFRYVANAHDGHGLVWNRAPFAPVEGYTCFGWVVLLWLTWEATGVAPPDAAHALSISFGVLLLLATAAAAARVQDRAGRRMPVPIVLLAVLCVAASRTSLHWFTSGLETAMFNLAFVGWVFAAFRADAARSERRLWIWSCWAAMAALTRPDGLLLVAATAAAGAAATLRGERSRWATIRALSPLVTVVAHVAWRRATYGEWLPNTYYAKVTEVWPEAGLRYLACFVIEQGAWVWLLVFLIWAVAAVVRGAGGVVRGVLGRLPACAAVCVVVFHVAYYCLRVGGDPFEYRVLSYLIPLGAVGVIGAAAQLPGAPRSAGVAVAALFLAGSLGWGHWLYHQPEVGTFYRPIASEVPSWIRPLARWHDRQQSWLKPQMLCGRPRVHDMQLRAVAAGLPVRGYTGFDVDDVPIYPASGVGLPAWRMPDVAILDEHGLNDWVVARSPKREAGVSLASSAALATVFAAIERDPSGRYPRDAMIAALAAVGDPGVARGLVDYLLMQLAPPGATALAPAELRAFDELQAGLRFMAHERLPPAGYVEDFAPNVSIRGGAVVVSPRAAPLTAARVRELEAEWRQRTLQRKFD